MKSRLFTSWFLPWLSGTATLSQGHDLSPQTLKLLQFSLPLHSLCWPSWFEKRAGGGLSSISPWCHSQHSMPMEESQEHQHRALKVTAETICRCVLSPNRSFSSCQRRSDYEGVFTSPQPAPAPRGSSQRGCLQRPQGVHRGGTPGPGL